MAKEAKPEAAAEAAPKKSKKLLIIILAAVFVLLAIGGGAAFFMMKKHAAEAEDEEDVVATAKPAKKKSPAKEVPPVYVPMETFTVNLTPESGEQFVQLVLSLEVEEAAEGERIKTYTPKIRNNVMLLLSGKRASELLTPEGKEKLATEIRAQINKVLAPGAKTDDSPVKEVLFTSFIIQ